MKKNKKKIKIIILALITLISTLFIGAYIIVVNLSNNPMVAISSALYNTASEVASPVFRFTTLFEEITNENWRHDASLGINGISTDMLDIDPRILSASQILTFRNTLRRAGRQMGPAMADGTLTLQFAVTPIVDVNFYADPNVIAFRVPQAFSHFLEVNPKKVAEDWDSSLLGAYLGPINEIIMEDEFYEYYSMLFNRGQKEESEPVDIHHYFDLMSAGMEFGEKAPVDYPNDGPLAKFNLIKRFKRRNDGVYPIVLHENASHELLGMLNPFIDTQPFPDDFFGGYLNSWIDAVNNIEAYGGTKINIRVIGGKINEMSVDMRLIVDGAAWDLAAYAGFIGDDNVLDNIVVNLAITNNGNGYNADCILENRVTDPNLVYSKGSIKITGTNEENKPIELIWDYLWDKNQRMGENLIISASAALPGLLDLSLGVNGLLIADTSAKIIDFDLKGLQVYANTLHGLVDASFQVKYILRADNTEIAYNSEGSVPIANVTEGDLEKMYEGLLSNPLLGLLF